MKKHLWTPLRWKDLEGCLITVVLVDDDLPYWTSQVQHLVALTAMFSNIVLRMRRNRYLWTSGVNLDTAVRFTNSDFYKSAKFQRFSDVFRWFLHFICWMSAIFLLPVYLIYWPTKYTTRVDPHIDNSHQVWSWYDHQLPRYSVFGCWYVTWPCDLDLWPWTDVIHGESRDQPRQ